MAGHSVTPYSVIARRRHGRGAKSPLLLGSLSDDTTVDILDVVESNITTVEPFKTADESKVVSCVMARRSGDAVGMVISVVTKGEQELIRDGDQIVFVKNQEHRTQHYSCALLWRPPTGAEGVLLAHSPWGRGGQRVAISKLIQRALNEEPLAKAQITVEPLVPDQVIERYLANVEATRIIYTKSAGVTSDFGRGRQTSSPAELELVVKGKESLPFRDALSKMLRRRRRGAVDELFAVRVRDPLAEAGYRDEIFDDVSIDIPTPGGMRRYSLKRNTIPTLGFDVTDQITSAYHDLATTTGDEDTWPERLLTAVQPRLEAIRRDVSPSP